MSCSRSRASRCQRLSLLHVRRIVAVGAVDDGVFPSGGNHLEFFAQITANRAAVGGNGPVAQAKSIKNLAIGTCHHLVAGFGGVLVTVKAVSVFHDEFARAHHAEAWPAFIPEFCLDVIEIARQLLVAFDLLAGDVGHHFFAGGLDDEVAVVPVFHAHQLGAHFFPAAGFLPEFSRLNHRHQQFHRPGAVHLFSHNRLDLADDPQTHRHVRVNARAQFFDHAGAHHQLVAGDFGIGRGFLLGGNKKLGCFHGLFSVAGRL